MSRPTYPIPEVSNPFASRFVRPGAIAYRDPSTRMPIDIERLLDCLGTVRLAAIVGDHGTGKSTLLHTLGRELETRFPGGQWVQLSREGGLGLRDRCRELVTNIQVSLRTQRSVAVGGILVIDGAEQLPGWARSRIAKRCQQRGQVSLMTTHRPIKHFETIHETSLDAKMVELLIGELLPTSDDAELIESIHQRIDKPVTNARDLWSELYDLFETKTMTRNEGNRWPSA